MATQPPSAPPREAADANSSAIAAIQPGSFGALSVVDAFRGKNVLLTGSTGFVGKCVLEKILRSCPDVNKVFLLVRPYKGSAADTRVQSEILGSECFDRLRRERPDFEQVAAAKVVALAGELTQKNVGLNQQQLDMLYEELDIVIHCAAVVDFNERIDRAIELNVHGSLRLLEIAKKCKRLRAFIHTSTCYVNSNRSGGWVDEKLYPLGFDPEQVLKKVEKMHVSELEKATLTGLLGDWPNTYTLTKTMCEHLMVKNRGSVPLVICRPSIIGCAAQEPVPGWIDVISAAGALMVAIGMGVLKFLPGLPTHLGDLVPVDFVVNALLSAVPAIWSQNRYFVSRVCSSTEHPLMWGTVSNVMMQCFDRFTSKQAVQKPSFSWITTPQMYQLHFFARYSIPASLMSYVSLLGPQTMKKKSAQLERLVWKVRVLIESFRHFVEHGWLFDNRNTRSLYKALVPAEREHFPLDLQKVNWPDYVRTFVYGLYRFVLKEDMVPMDPVNRNLYVDLMDEDMNDWSASFFRRVANDVDWVLTKARDRPHFPASRPVPEMRALVLSSPEVRAAIENVAARSSLSVLQVEAQAKAIADKMFGDASLPVVQGMGWMFRKIWRKIYRNIRIEAKGLEQVRAAAAKGPVIFLPTHRSYIDFLIVSYLCLAERLPVPYIAAGEDFLGIMLVRWLFRHSGAFFIRRSFSGDELYSAIFDKYVEQLLQDGQSMEFFIEGTRSRGGKMLHPKMGLLSVVTQAYLDKKVPNATIVPIALNYEKTIEGNLYSSELHGDNKIRESLKSLLRSSHVININFGSICMKFGKIFTLSEFTEQHVNAVRSSATLTHVPSALPPSSSPPVLALPASVPTAPNASGTKSAKPTPLATSLAVLNKAASAAAASKGKAAKKEEKTLADDGMPNSAAADNSAVSIADSTAFEESSSSKQAVRLKPAREYDPVNDLNDRKYFNRALAYEIVYQLAQASQCMPTHLVAALLLMYRQGITRDQLIAKVDWLRNEIAIRGGEVIGAEREDRTTMVMNAINHLRGLIVERRPNVFEPAISSRMEYPNMLTLGLYRNKMMHLFFREGLWALALYSFGGNHAVEKARLLEEVKFLYSLLHLEFVIKPDLEQPEDFEASLQFMVARGILRYGADGTTIEVAPTGETHFSFLCALFWPFIDSYYVATMVLFTLQPNRSVDEETLRQRTQWLATTLYHESMLCFYESCSKETLNNAFVLLQSWKVITIEREKARAKPKASRNKIAVVRTPSPKLIVRLNAPFHEEAALTALLERIERMRKPPPVRREITGAGLRRNLIADVPILAKL